METKKREENECIVLSRGVLLRNPKRTSYNTKSSLWPRKSKHVAVAKKVLERCIRVIIKRLKLSTKRFMNKGQITSLEVLNSDINFLPLGDSF